MYLKGLNLVCFVFNFIIICLKKRGKFSHFSSVVFSSMVLKIDQKQNKKECRLLITKCNTIYWFSLQVLTTKIHFCNITTRKF
jgi:hypothetical protein